MAEQCSAALLKDVTSLSWQSAETYAFAQAIQSLHQSGQAGSIGGTVSIDGAPIRLNGQYLKKVTDLFMRQTGIAWTSQKSLELISSTLSANAVQAYRDCLRAKSDGPQVLAYDARPEHVFIEVRWTSPAGALHDSEGDVAISGGTPESPFPKEWKSGDRHVRLINRDKGKDLDVTANIGRDNDRISVPYLPQFRVTKTKHSIVHPEPPAAAVRLANDGTGRSVGPLTDSIPAPNDWIIDPTTARIDILVRAGTIDNTTYAKITTATEDYVVWQALLRPLAKEGGGDLQFRVQFDAYEWKFEPI